MITIIDYGVGNLFSLCSSLKMLGREAILTSAPEQIRSADRIILPGVGAFGDAAALLRKDGLDLLIKEQVRMGKPLLGICLGMQLLFEKSYEFGEHDGLNLLHGQVVDMRDRIPKDLKIPHIGWNSLNFKKNHPLLQNVHEGDYVYFVHSFFAEDCNDSLIAATEYGIEMTALVAEGNVMGCQFHPEKSGKVSLSILEAFCEL